MDDFVEFNEDFHSEINDFFRSDSNKISYELDNSYKKIYIWTKKQRRTINTYMYGWDLDKNELKNHHRSLKKKFACNGSLKMSKVPNMDEKYLVFHLSCKCPVELKNYLIKNEIPETMIEIKIF